MNWAAITLSLLLLAGLLTAVVKDGKPRRPWSAIEALTSFMIVAFLLWQAGFFG